MITGDRLKALREMRGMTLDDVAKIVGVSNATVSRWETGEIRNIRNDKIACLARALKTSEAYLFGFTDNPDWKPNFITSYTAIFRDQLSQMLENHDASDIYEKFGTNEPFNDVFEGRTPLTLERACEIAVDIGESLDYLVGLSDESGKSTGAIDVSSLAVAIKKTCELSSDDAMKVAEVCAALCQTDNSSEFSAWYRVAPVELQKAALAVLKSSTKDGKSDG